MIEWDTNITERDHAVKFARYLLCGDKKILQEACAKEILNWIRASGKLKFNLTPRALGRALADSHQFKGTYKYCSYVRDKATVWRCV